MANKKPNYQLINRYFNFPPVAFNLYLYLNFVICSFIKNGKKHKIIKKFFDLEIIFQKQYKVSLMKVFFFCFQLSKILLGFKVWNLGRKQIQIAFLPRNYFRNSGRQAARLLVTNIKARTERTFLLRLFAELDDIMRRRSLLEEQKKRIYLSLLNNKHYLRFLRFSKPAKYIYRKKV